MPDRCRKSDRIREAANLAGADLDSLAKALHISPRRAREIAEIREIPMCQRVAAVLPPRLRREFLATILRASAVALGIRTVESRTRIARASRRIRRLLAS